METTTLPESDGIAEMRRMIKEFLNSGEGSAKVRKYISSVTQDDTLLRIYLKGRKFRASYAWETLKRNAEVRCDSYPEIFSEDTNEIILKLKKYGVMNILKSRDESGRRIMCCDTGKWDANEINAELITIFATYFFERGLFDEDIISNGLIFIQNCSEMGLRHASMYTLHTMLRIINIFWHSYPIKLEAAYFINAPSYFFYPYKLVRPFLPKKFKERLVVSSNFGTLHDKVSPSLLPKSLGGVQKNETAFDLEFLEPKIM